VNNFLKNAGFRSNIISLTFRPAQRRSFPAGARRMTLSAAKGNFSFAKQKQGDEYATGLASKKLKHFR